MISDSQIAELYRLLAGTSSLFDAGTVTDNDGRRGIAVGFDATLPGGTRSLQRTDYLVIDVATGRPLEYEEIVDPGRNLDPALPDRPIVYTYELLDSSFS